MECVQYTVKSVGKSNCNACTNGRPTSQVVPFPLGWNKEPAAMGCMVKLYQDREAWGDPSCHSLSLKFPAIKPNEASQHPLFSGVTGIHHICVTGLGTKGIGKWEASIGAGWLRKSATPPREEITSKSRYLELIYGDTVEGGF